MGEAHPEPVLPERLPEATQGLCLWQVQQPCPSRPGLAARYTCRVDAASSQRQPCALLSRVGGSSSDPATGSWVQTRDPITLLAILKSDQLPIKVPNEEGLLRLSRDRQEWASAGGIEEGCLEESSRRAVQGTRLGWGPRVSG